MNQNVFRFNSQGPDVKRLLIAGILMFSFAALYGYFFGNNNVNVNNDKNVNITNHSNNVNINNDIGSNNDYFLNYKELNNIKNVKSIYVDFSNNLKNKVGRVINGGYKISLFHIGGCINAINILGYENDIHLVKYNISKLSLLSISSNNNNFTLNANANYKIVKLDNNNIVFEHITTENIVVRRFYNMDNENYLLKHKIIITNKSLNNKLIDMNIYMPMEYDLNNKNSVFSSDVGNNDGIVLNINNKKEKILFKNLENKLFQGNVQYVGFDKQYFLISMMPDVSKDTFINVCEVKKISNMINKDKNIVLLILKNKLLQLNSGKSHVFSYLVYFGPKQLSILQDIGYNLDENINFGWFGVISRPLLWLLVKIFNIVGNFGIAIIILTIFIKLITFPLTQKSFVSMQKMKEFQPYLKELQQKYRHDRLLLGQKQMELYKEKGISPLAGCLPMVLQMPIWFALYQMLWNSVELYQQPFIWWLTNLTAPDPYYILPIIMGISMLIQAILQPTLQDNQQMKYVMWGMPVFLTFIMLRMPCGLSLYILINNILTILQQIYIKRVYSMK